MDSLARLLQAFDPKTDLDVPAHWRQGRTVYGGLSAALALQAVLRAPGDALPALRAAQVNFIGPAVDALRFTETRLRRGKTAAWVEADCRSAGELALRAMFLFADARQSTIAHDFTAAPAVAAPHELAPMPASPLAPAFFGHFDVRFAGPARPVSGAAAPELLAWVRHRDATGVHPAVALVALADCLPPAAMAAFTRPAPISTMTWSFELRRLPEPGQWFLLRSSSQRAADGYSMQRMELWDEHGEPVLSGCQSVALFA